jgi:hypothetical protein
MRVIVLSPRQKCKTFVLPTLTAYCQTSMIDILPNSRMPILVDTWMWT